MTKAFVSALFLAVAAVSQVGVAAETAVVHVPFHHFVCSAQSVHGRVFTAESHDRRVAEHRALESCAVHSHRACRLLGCR